MDEKASIELENEASTADVSEDSATFHLEKLVIDTDIKFRNENADLQKIVGKYANREVSLSDLRSAVGEIMLYFCGRGYPAATAYLHPQDIKDGIAHIGIEPGRFGVITIDNQSHVKNSVIECLTKGLRQGDVIRGWDLESTVYNIIGLGGVKARDVMRLGSEQGIITVSSSK